MASLPPLLLPDAACGPPVATDPPLQTCHYVFISPTVKGKVLTMVHGELPSPPLTPFLLSTPASLGPHCSTDTQTSPLRAFALAIPLCLACPQDSAFRSYSNDILLVRPSWPHQLTLQPPAQHSLSPSPAFSSSYHLSPLNMPLI